MKVKVWFYDEEFYTDKDKLVEALKYNDEIYCFDMWLNKNHLPTETLGKKASYFEEEYLEYVCQRAERLELNGSMVYSKIIEVCTGCPLDGNSCDGFSD